MTNKYPTSVYDAVSNYYAENYGLVLSNEDIDKMEKRTILEAYLLWEGIFGYTDILCDIMEA